MIDINHLRILLAALLSIFVISGCAAEMGEDVAALVNGRPIKTDSLNRALHSSSGVRGGTAYKGEVVKIILNQLIEEELILQEAEKLKINVTKAELKSKVDEIKADYPGRSLEEMLVKEYILMDEWLNSLKRSLLIEKAIENRLKSRVNMNAQEMKTLYQTHRADLIHPLLVKIDHLTCASRKEAEKALRNIHSTKDFNGVAQKYKAEETESLRKAIGWINPKNLPAEISQAILQTEPGQISGIVESKYGYSIIKVLEVKEAKPMSLEQVENYLRRSYMARQETRVLTEWIEELKNNAKIKINPLLSSLFSQVQETKE
ncbi:MAG: peptidyl-prolyl cis-trans isomerase [Deltaproteobacteria bacterium]|nr:peptidyl-prolyl cis-trans isomerase [Deltaproteobacteria bacterium]MBW2050643.1 peptidyl-prolyl cis-trans isomerase [Deltaproteobacteria bacterium]MBW2139463.1 peptidyl-prolyl cis-trans isomerase [Deltaproteobacteria bacterium]MBW2322212.1 peptidyl-prolyl cis-trans isomerase [Deltaproteobacteria bacterium]